MIYFLIAYCVIAAFVITLSIAEEEHFGIVIGLTWPILLVIFISLLSFFFTMDFFSAVKMGRKVRRANR